MKAQPIIAHQRMKRESNVLEPPGYKHLRLALCSRPGLWTLLERHGMPLNMAILRCGLDFDSMGLHDVHLTAAGHCPCGFAASSVPCDVHTQPRQTACLPPALTPLPTRDAETGHGTVARCCIVQHHRVVAPSSNHPHCMHCIEVNPAVDAMRVIILAPCI